MTDIAFANDCDLMAWIGFSDVHDLLKNLRLPAGDSFWLFDPSGGDMGLFTYDTDHKGPHHNHILDAIASGTLDVIHSSGNFTSRHGSGYKPDRGQTAKAFEYLDKYASVPRIWSNHGDELCHQNIGGSDPLPYHRGDLPGSEYYILDLLLDYGIKYFWRDNGIIRDLNAPWRLLAPETCRDGHVIQTMKRYFSPRITHSPNGKNLYLALDDVMERNFLDKNQNVVLYSHWGCDHDESGRSFTPQGHPLSKESVSSLERLAEMHANGFLKVHKLSDLLQIEEKKSLCSEAQRVCEYIVNLGNDKADACYTKQYSEMGIKYFEQRVEQLGVTGDVALDAGCGVGQWSFALTNCFNTVIGVDQNDDAITLLDQITNLVRQESPKFFKGKIEAIDFPDSYFDFVFCYGVIMFTDVVRVLQEFYRVLQPGGRAYICLNGDGFHESCTDVRFQNNEEMQVAMCSLLWNALYFRLDAESGIDRLLQLPEALGILKQSMPSEIEMQRLFILIESLLTEDHRVVVSHYSARVRDIVMLFLREYVSNTRSEFKKNANGVWLNELPLKIEITIDRILRRSAKTRSITLKLIRKYSRYEMAYSSLVIMPEEFSQVILASGFSDFHWAPEGKLLGELRSSSIVSSVYDSDYKGQLGVWECLITKNPVANP